VNEVDTEDAFPFFNQSPAENPVEWLKDFQSNLLYFADSMKSPCYEPTSLRPLDDVCYYWMALIAEAREYLGEIIKHKKQILDWTESKGASSPLFGIVKLLALFVQYGENLVEKRIGWETLHEADMELLRQNIAKAEKFGKTVDDHQIRIKLSDLAGDFMAFCLLGSDNPKQLMDQREAQNNEQLDRLAQRDEAFLSMAGDVCLISAQACEELIMKTGQADKTKSDPDKRKTGRTRGRKKLRKKEEAKRLRILKLWSQASEAGISRKQFCGDKDIDITEKELERYQAWKRQRNNRE
jgi:hypothetical protein